MDEKREWAAAVWHKKHILVAGGRGDGYHRKWKRSAEMMNVATRTWTQLPDLPVAPEFPVFFKALSGDDARQDKSIYLYGVQNAVLFRLDWELLQWEQVPQPSSSNCSDIPGIANLATAPVWSSSGGIIWAMDTQGDIYRVRITEPASFNAGEAMG